MGIPPPWYWQALREGRDPTQQPQDWNAAAWRQQLEAGLFGLMGGGQIRFPGASAFGYPWTGPLSRARERLWPSFPEVPMTPAQGAEWQGMLQGGSRPIWEWPGWRQMANVGPYVAEPLRNMIQGWFPSQVEQMRQGGWGSWPTPSPYQPEEWPSTMMY